jgi:hypothetical protein
MSIPNHELRISIALALLFAPMIISRLGHGSKRFWSEYALWVGGLFLIFALAGWLVHVGLDVTGESQVLQVVGDFAGISFVFGACAFIGGSFAEKAAGRMGRY